MGGQELMQYLPIPFEQTSLFLDQLMEVKYLQPQDTCYHLLLSKQQSSQFIQQEDVWEWRLHIECHWPQLASQNLLQDENGLRNIG